MTCTDCAATREASRWPYHDVACIYCGARLIQRIRRYSIPVSELTERRRAVLADWVAHGHDEAQLRALVKGPLAVEPIEKAKGKA